MREFLYQRIREFRGWGKTYLSDLSGRVWLRESTARLKRLRKKSFQSKIAALSG
jgi:hypothetical protein